MTPQPRSARGARRAEPRSEPRAALLLPALYGGGAERVVLNLARGLCGQGHAVDLVVASRVGSLRDATPAGVELVDLGAGRMLSALPALVRYLRRRRPSALLSAMGHTNVIALWAAGLARFDGRVVVSEHTEVRPAASRPLKQRLTVPTMRWSYPRAHRVVAVSHGVKRSLVRELGLRPDAIEVVYNPVITPESRAAAAAAADHPFLDGASRIVLGIGRLIRAKGFDRLLRAFARVCQDRDAKLIVLGDGEQRDELEALAASLGIAARVSFAGFVPNPHAYLARADVFCLASEMEGLPTVLIEALAAGARIVATDCSSGVREVVADGRYGHLVPVGDDDALAGAIDRALDEPSPVIDDAWLTPFTMEAASARYAAVLGLGGDTSSPGGCPSERRERATQRERQHPPRP